METSSKTVHEYVERIFYGDYLEGLKEFVRIPSLSSIFDAEWQTNKNLFKQQDHLIAYAEKQNIKGAKVIALKDEGKSPFLIVDVAPTNPDNKNCVLLYGHLDKQPFGEGWDTNPQEPVIKDGKLYGRGSSDDGYAFFTAVTAIKACQDNGLPHPRCVITIEGSEEGELDDLIYYMATYKNLLGSPNLVICLDSAAYSPDTTTITSSLRGCINFDLKAKISRSNLHSGIGGGIMPNPYLILNALLQRIQNFQTQEVIADFQVQIPAHRDKECREVALKLPRVTKGLPLLDGVQSVAHQAGAEEDYHLYLNSQWKAQLSVIGFEGLPSLENAGNVIYKELAMRCSMRLPPTLTGEEAEVKLRAKLLAPGNDTYGAHIEFVNQGIGNGFDAPKLPDEVYDKLLAANKSVFNGNEPMFVGCGGSIPFMEVFAGHFPEANFLLTGCGFIDSNAHSSNENLDLEYCRKLTTVLAEFLSKM